MTEIPWWYSQGPVARLLRDIFMEDMMSFDEDSLSFVHMLLRRLWKCLRWYDCRQLGSIDVLCMSSTQVRNNYWVIKVILMMRGLMMNTLESEKKMTEIPWWYSQGPVARLLRDIFMEDMMSFDEDSLSFVHMLLRTMWKCPRWYDCRQLGSIDVLCVSSTWVRNNYWVIKTILLVFMRGHVAHIEFKVWNGMATILLMKLYQSLHFDQWQKLHFD